MRRISRQAASDTSLNDLDPQSLAWMYAFLLDYGAFNNFLHSHGGFADDNIARAQRAPFDGCPFVATLVSHRPNLSNQQLHAGVMTEAGCV